MKCLVTNKRQISLRSYIEDYDYIVFVEIGASIFIEGAAFIKVIGGNPICLMISNDINNICPRKEESQKVEEYIKKQFFSYEINEIDIDFENDIYDIFIKKFKDTNLIIKVLNT